MTINVIDFYREDNGESLQNPFVTLVERPVFSILVDVNGRTKEFVLKLSGAVECPFHIIENLKDFEIESYRNYLIITDFLLGENGEKLRENWGFTKEDFRELIFELYFCLVKEHATCGIFKKAFLVLIGLWKFYMRRRLV